MVEIAGSESFRNARPRLGRRATEDTDYTAQLDLKGLPPGEEVFYRVSFQSLDDPRALSEPVVGHFRTAPGSRRDLSFVWSGDTAGQGWGINPAVGGMTTYETMRQLQPDFFIHSGDTIYADGPLEPEVALPGGGVWHNIVTEEKSKVAETLMEFRGNHRYNLLDDNVRRFNAEVPILAQWDDHETTNNWFPGEVLEDPRYSERDVDVLAARARQAFHEYLPIRQSNADEGRIYRRVDYGPSLELFFLDMRTHRGPNSANLQAEPGADTALLGERQLRWLEGELRRSKATWKVIASDLPLGLVVADGAEAFEGVANADGGVPLGREHEIARVLSFIKRRQITNVVWLTADVHYTAAHYYDPNKATFDDFEPFWEFVSGPLNAGTFGPGALDATFGPQVRFRQAPGPDAQNLPPSAGMQFFGHVAIDGDTEVMTVRLMDVAGATLYQADLDPA